MQQQLIENARKTPARPSRYSDEVLRDAAITLAKPVGQWLEGAEPKGARLEEILFEMLDTAIEYDGYELAKILEDDLIWAVNAELVEILDGAESAISSAYEEAQKVWVKAHDIRPKYAAGQRLRLPAKLVDFRSENDSLVIATIIKVMADVGRYWLNCPELGHVHPDSGKCGTTGIFKDYEDIDDIVAF